MQFSTNEKKIIRLLKVWKVENNLKLKSIHIEFLVKKAFEKANSLRNRKMFTGNN